MDTYQIVINTGTYGLINLLQTLVVVIFLFSVLMVLLKTLPSQPLTQKRISIKIK